VTRPPKFEDTKSMVSKVSSRAGSQKAKPSASSGILSREEEARIAKEKKERLDSIKR
jgi:hypothetical protein